MALEAGQIWETFRRRGMGIAALSAFSALALGLIDSFTAQIIPTLATRVENYLYPPEYYVVFTVPVEVDKSASVVSPIPSDEQRSAELRLDSANRSITISGSTGLYWLELHRVDGRKLVVGDILIKEDGDHQKLDTSESNWETDANIEKGIAEAVTSINDPSGSPRLKQTRWVVTETDYAVVQSVKDATRKAILSAALGEVGTYEFGAPEEKARIYAYWETTPELLRRNGIALDHLGRWGGAFLAWVVSGTGQNIPTLATAYNSWPGWGTSAPIDQPSPGMIAIFRTNDVRELTGDYLVGIVLRRNVDCTEIISGNIVDRVVITCVTLPIEYLRQPI